MEPQRVEAYIRASCSVLDFDMGELWCARRTEGGLDLKFKQLYSSPAFEDFHGLLVQPRDTNNDENTDHVISPIICRGVCDGGQIVWANTRLSDGFTGRSEVPLNTAVGVPICSVDSDLYILVLFAVGTVSMTPSAIEYLVCLVRAVAMRTGGFLSASFTVPVTAPKCGDLQWDFNELARKYPNDVDLQVLPMKNVQNYFDYNEMMLFCELFQDYKLARKGNFTDKQLESLRDALKIPTRTAETNGIAFNVRHQEEGERSSAAQTPRLDGLLHRSAASPAKSTSAFSDSNWSAVDGRDGAEERDAGVYCADDIAVPTALDLHSLQQISASLQSSSASSVSGQPPAGGAAASSSGSGTGSGSVGASEDEHSPRNVLALLRRVNESAAVPNDSLLHIYAHMSYRLSQCRFHEFMIAMLGMTVFDSSELWLLSDHSSELHLMAAVYRTATMQKWTSSGISLRLQIGTDVPGRVMSTEHFCWDPRYCEEGSATGTGSGAGTSSASGGGSGSGGSGTSSSGDFSRLRPARNGPRMSFAKELGLHTAFGVPVPGMRGPCGALVFYTTKAGMDLDPLMVQLVESGVQIMANTSLDPTAFTDGHDREGSAKLAAWLQAAGMATAGAAAHREPTTTGKSTVPAAQEEAPPAPQPATTGTRVLDFNSRLQLCRSIVASKKTGGADANSADSNSRLDLAALLDMTRVGAALKYNPLMQVSSASSSSGAAAGPRPSAAEEGAGQSRAPGIPPHAARSSFGGAVSNSSTLNEDMYGDAVVSAARALANFGNFQWSTFLEGSGIEEAGDGYNSMKLGSDKLLNAYQTEWQGGSGRKRKLSHSGSVASAEGIILPVCLVVGCGYFAESPEAQYCATHRGTRRCQKEGCGKCAQGATKFCIAHGGGRRCTYPGCFKGARDKLFCAAHGGGKRCTHEGCTKSAVGGSALCTAHGGGKRCKFEGCNKSSQSSTDFCVKHGGGRSCIFKGCNKVARGKTDYCAAHGGGVRCKAKGCYKIAVGATNLCRMHGTAQQQQAAAATTSGASSSSSAGNLSLARLVTEAERSAKEVGEVGSGSGSGESSDESDMDEEQVLYGRSK